MAQSRRSMSLVREMHRKDDEIETDEVTDKRSQWESAVAQELEEIFNKQNELEQKLEALSFNSPQDSPTLNVTRQDAVESALNEKVDALTDMIKKLINDHEREKTALNGEINKLKTQIQAIQNEKQTSLENDDIVLIKEYVARQIEDLEVSHEARFSELSRANPSPAIAVNTQKFKIELPKFKGTEYERPIKFLNELERYFQIMKPSDDVVFAIISQALQETAQSWFYIKQDEMRGYEDFVKKFKEQYWNANTQRNAFRKIELGQFYEGGKLTRVNYAIHVYGLAKELNLDLPEDQLATKICGHFEKGIRHAFNGQSIKDKNALLSILADFDEDDVKEKSRKNYVRVTQPGDKEGSYNRGNNYRQTPSYNNKFSRPVQTNAISYVHKAKTENASAKRPETRTGHSDACKGAYPKQVARTSKPKNKYDENIDVLELADKIEEGACAMPKNAK